MAGMRRQGSGANDLKWQSFQARRIPPSGKKPVPEPTTLQDIVVMLIMHVCRKIVLFETEIKICIYLGALVCVSLVCDFAPVPRTYFSNKNNMFNQYFVKFGWGWTLIAVSTFMGLSSWVYCCGNIDRVKVHFYRLGIGTLMWYTWTNSFLVLESMTMGCLSGKHLTKEACLKSGSRWVGFDISGHAFLLIYCSLLIAEEAKAFRGWERIGELLRNEEYDEESPLRSLSEPELTQLKENYLKLTPYVKLAFGFITVLYVLWDVMLIATVLYFHSMVQKVIGGVIAILCWYATYRWWYQLPMSPGLPGQGPFKYAEQPPLSTKKTCLHRF